MGKKYLPAILILALSIISGCNKETSRIGFNLQPEGDQLDVMSSDTSSIYAYSVLVDSIRTNGTPVSLFGSINDPVFGITTASFSVQFRLSEVAYSFGNAPVLDSLVLSLKPVGVYGDSLAIQRLKVYELTEQLVLDSSYYSNSNVGYSSTLIADLDIVANLTDSVVVGKDTLEPHIRLSMTSLGDELALKLLNATDEQMTSNADFLDFFYGLRIEAEEKLMGGNIIYFNLDHSLSKMTIYYSNADEDSLQYNYNITSNSVRFGNFTHDYSQGDLSFRQQVINGDTASGDNIVYVQPLAGVKTRVFFPNIKSWYDDGPVSVVEAKLILEGYEEEPFEDAPPNIILLKINSDGTSSPLDEILQGQIFFGGFYDDDLNGYFFRITNHIQDILKEDAEDYGLELFVDGGSYVANRFLMNGPQPYDPAKEGSRMRLEIILTTP